MDSITRAQYVLRTVIGATNQRYHYYLSDQLFRDLKLDISLRVLSNRLKGLVTKKAADANKEKPRSQSSTQSAPTGNTSPQASAHQAFNKPDLPQGKPTEAQRALAAEHLAQMRRRKPPPG